VLNFIYHRKIAKKRASKTISYKPLSQNFPFVKKCTFGTSFSLKLFCAHIFLQRRKTLMFICIFEISRKRAFALNLCLYLIAATKKLVKVKTKQFITKKSSMLEFDFKKFCTIKMQFLTKFIFTAEFSYFLVINFFVIKT
jgi:hypothetical protein